MEDDLFVVTSADDSHIFTDRDVIHVLDVHADLVALTSLIELHVRTDEARINVVEVGPTA